MVDEAPLLVLPVAAVFQVANLDVVGPGVAMPDAQLENAPQVIEAPTPVTTPAPAPAPVRVAPVPIIYLPKQDRN